MKRKVLNRLLAASMATVMTMGMAGCGNGGQTPADQGSQTTDPGAGTTDQGAGQDTSEGQTAEEDGEDAVGGYTVITDPATGEAYDLGGMEIIIRDWWSGDPAEPTNDYEEARDEYRDWIQETYNFTIKQQAISDWGSTPQDYVDYCTTGDDGNNYIFILRDDPAITSAMASGLMYDLATLDCLDFSQEKFTKNMLHEQYSYGDSIYCMYAGDPEPRTGVYFNKRLLNEAQIDPESIYDLQASGDWTWDKWTELMEQVQRDTNNDGAIDIYGTTQNNSTMVLACVYSNGGELVGKDASGKFTYRVEDPETIEGLQFSVDIMDNYTLPYPEEAQWDYYKEAFRNGMAVFMVDDGYAGTPGNYLQDMEDDFGFVMFPKGPQMSDYINCFANNPVAIPGCYDADKAWKLAFAWNLYTDDIPGYEDYEGWKSNYYAGFRDTRAVDETAAMMMEKGMITYHGIIPDLDTGDPFLYQFYSGCDVSANVEAIRESWKNYIDKANQK